MGLLFKVSHERENQKIKELLYIHLLKILSKFSDTFPAMHKKESYKVMFK